ncbi:hypothetical protein GGR51DRAFT_568279 [Nemania sp. FL0031]|nr:hypothetical protein GGR51DRAFT_568279 [Nemania sp. FL0031]
MNSDSHSAPAAGPSPAGDIGNHVLPQVIVIFTGIMVAVATFLRLLARRMMNKLDIMTIDIRELDIRTLDTWKLVIGKLGNPDLWLIIPYIYHHYNAYQVAIYPGLGVHQWQYNAELAASSHYSWKVGSVCFGINIAFLKIAILLDWRNTFVAEGTRNTLFWILTSLIWSNGLFYLIGTFIEGFQCPPNKIGTPGCNIDVGKYNIASGIINVISDLTILIAPHWVIWNLKLSLARKTGISLLFTIGVLATGSAVARVIYAAKAYDTDDILYYSVIINLWAIAEQTFGYLVIGVPAIPKVVKGFPCAKYFGSLARSRARQSSTEQGSRWPCSTSRQKSRNTWGAGKAEEADTYVLVAVPEQARVYRGPVPTNSSRDEIEISATYPNHKLARIL